MLLNAALTIEQGKRESHQDLWGRFTELLVFFISKNAPPSAWILWGKEAHVFDQFINNKKHYKNGGHPSPMAAKNVFCGNYFTFADEFLARKRGVGKVIDWRLPSVKREIENIVTRNSYNL